MTKKEQARLEAALTAAALRRTSAEGPDVLPSALSQKPATGFLPLLDGDNSRVEIAWSAADRHDLGEPPTGHILGGFRGSRPLYSTRLRALRALRVAVEEEAAKRLRQIDRLIEEEEAG